MAYFYKSNIRNKINSVDICYINPILGELLSKQYGGGGEKFAPPLELVS